MPETKSIVSTTTEFCGGLLFSLRVCDIFYRKQVLCMVCKKVLAVERESSCAPQPACPDTLLPYGEQDLGMWNARIFYFTTVSFCREEENKYSSKSKDQKILTVKAS